MAKQRAELYSRWFASTSPPAYVQPEGSMAFALTKVPVELDTRDEADLEAIVKIYERFWMECQGCYVFEMDKKYEVDIDQLDFALTDWTIRAYEEREMEKMQNYFINMPNRTTR